MSFAVVEDGAPIAWDNDYDSNESECFIQSRSDDRIVLCGAMMSEAFIIDTAVTVEYDGCISIDAKIMPRGQTVAQVFGTAKIKRREYRLDRLWLEIPLRADAAEFYNIYPIGDIRLEDGRIIKRGETMSSAARQPARAVGRRLCRRKPEISAALLTLRFYADSGKGVPCRPISGKDSAPRLLCQNKGQLHRLSQSR